MILEKSFHFFSKSKVVWNVSLFHLCNLLHNNCLDSCAYNTYGETLCSWFVCFFCFPVFWFLVLINLFAKISEMWKHGAIRVLRLVQCQTIRTGYLVIYLYSIAEITCWVFFTMTCLSLLFFFGTLQIN